MQCFSGIIGLTYIAEAEGDFMDFLKANYHTHTVRCRHAYDPEREYIETAIKMGIKKTRFLRSHTMSVYGWICVRNKDDHGAGSGICIDNQDTCRGI